MPALDTNVLVRYVVEDDDAQPAAARRLIGRCVDEGLSLFVPITVVLELEWVLRSTYGFGKDDMLSTLSSLFSAAELGFESERALEATLQLPRGLGRRRRLPARRPGDTSRRAATVDLRPARRHGQRRPVAGQGMNRAGRRPSGMPSSRRD